MIATDQLDKAGRTYFRVVPILGAGVLGWALLDLILSPPSSWAWLPLAALTILTGSFTVKIPGLVARLSVSEPFVFAATLWFGPSVGAVTASLDALVMSLWIQPSLKTIHRTAFNVSVLVISIWAASEGFFALAGIDSRAPVYNSLSEFVVPLYIFTACCFLLNSGLVAVALAFERKQSALRIWREQFLWLSLNYFGGASVAAVLVVYAKSMDFAIVGVIVPLLAISYLTFRTTLGRLDDAHSHLRELNRLYLSTIETLATAVDAKDQVTHGHIRRVQRYALGLAERLGVNDSRLIKAIEAAALLHDMGKLAIPDYILNKPGRLTALEFDKMKLHAGFGADILSSIDFPYPVIPIVRHHHENWDGSGYPDALRGTSIPMGARILSVVDCFDALTSDRPYRPRLSNDDALAIILARRGSMYDPVVVDIFTRHLGALGQSAADPGPESPALRQIADLNNPAALAELQNSDTVIVPDTELTSTDWVAEVPADGGIGDMAATILGRVSGRIPATGCCLSLVEPDGATLNTCSVAGLVPTEYLGTKTDFGRRISGWVAANRATSVNGIAALDLDQVAGTGGLTSSLVCTIETNGRVCGVLAFFSETPDAFSRLHRTAVEKLSSRLANSLDRHRNHRRTARITQEIASESLLSRIAGDGMSQNRWPVGIVVTQFTAALNSAATQQAVWNTLRCSVRTGDSLLQIQANAFLLLILRSDEAATSQTANRLREEFSNHGIEVDVEWASVAHEEDADSQALDSLAQAIRQTTARDKRAPGTTH